MTEDQIELSCRKLCELQGVDPDADVQINVTPPQPRTAYASGLEIVHAVHIQPQYKTIPQWETYREVVVLHDNLTMALAYGKNMPLVDLPRDVQKLQECIENEAKFFLYVSGNGSYATKPTAEEIEQAPGYTSDVWGVAFQDARGTYTYTYDLGATWSRPVNASTCKPPEWSNQTVGNVTYDTLVRLVRKQMSMRADFNLVDVMTESDVGMDSLDHVEFIMACEDTFKIVISDVEATNHAKDSLFAFSEFIKQKIGTV